MNTIETKIVEVNLTEKDIKDAICFYLKSLPNHARELDSNPINIDFRTELSEQKTFGQVNATVTVKYVK